MNKKIFAVAGALCVRAFYGAGLMKNEASLTDTLTTEYSAVAEQVGAADSVSDVTEFIVSRYPYCSMTKCIDETTFSVAFGAENKPLDPGDETASVAYIMGIHLEYPDSMLTATMTCTGSDYSITAKHNLSGEN